MCCMLAVSAGEVAAAQAALAAKATELEAAGRQVGVLQSQLEEVTGALQDAHDQLNELQVGANV